MTDEAEAKIVAPCPGPCGGFYDLWASIVDPTPPLCEECTALALRDLAERRGR